MIGKTPIAYRPISATTSGGQASSGIAGTGILSPEGQTVGGAGLVQNKNIASGALLVVKQTLSGSGLFLDTGAQSYSSIFDQPASVVYKSLFDDETV